MATYTTQNAGKVERLVLYAPSWIRQTPLTMDERGKPLARLSPDTARSVQPKPPQVLPA
jgi:hypothetical protein